MEILSFIDFWDQNKNKKSYGHQIVKMKEEDFLNSKKMEIQLPMIKMKKLSGLLIVIIKMVFIYTCKMMEIQLYTEKMKAQFGAQDQNSMFDLKF